MLHFDSRRILHANLCKNKAKTNSTTRRDPRKQISKKSIKFITVKKFKKYFLLSHSYIYQMYFLKNLVFYSGLIL